MLSALTVGSSDCSGGAGIQADLKTFSSLGIHGCSVIVCSTAQNTQGVYSIHQHPLEIIDEQFNAVFSDINIKAAKTGMLYSKEIVTLVAERLSEVTIPLVVDPVMIATVGASLHKEDLLESLIKDLFPLATVVTPNIHEASVITNSEIKNLKDIENACREIYELGCGNVLIKGGHLEGKEAIDFLYDGKKIRRFHGERFAKEVHGTGCAFSSFITGFLAKGYELKDAVEKSKECISTSIKFSCKIGKGVEVVNPLTHFINAEEKYRVLKELKNESEELKRSLPLGFVPEVGINFGYALPFASSSKEICALEGRILKVKNAIHSYGGVDYNTSKHIAAVILAAMHFDKEMRCALNIKYSEEILNSCKQNLTIGSFDRVKEPKGVSTMEWGSREAIAQLGKVPDIIYDLGCVGKEPMIRIIGKNPKDVLRKLTITIGGLK